MGETDNCQRFQLAVILAHRVLAARRRPLLAWVFKIMRRADGDRERRRRAAGWQSGLGLVLAFAMTAAGCGRSGSITPAATTGEMPDQEVTDFALTETDAGHLQWKLFAHYAATYESRNLIVVHGVRVDFFDELGKSSSTLTAQEGDIQQQTHDMTARGNVKLQTSDGIRMTTQLIRFLNREQKIVSPEDQQVRVERHGDVLTGYGFESDPELRRFEFKRGRAVVRTQSGGGIIERPAGPEKRAPSAPETVGTP
jgi:LPS export ABC transporter protein LptC